MIQSRYYYTMISDSGLMRPSPQRTVSLLYTSGHTCSRIDSSNCLLSSGHQTDDCDCLDTLWSSCIMSSRSVGNPIDAGMTSHVHFRPCWIDAVSSAWTYPLSHLTSVDMLQSSQLMNVTRGLNSIKTKRRHGGRRHRLSMQQSCVTRATVLLPECNNKNPCTREKLATVAPHPLNRTAYEPTMCAHLIVKIASKADSAHILKSLAAETIDTYPNTITHVYTDGSVLNAVEQAGYHLTIQYTDATRKSEACRQHCNNYDAELKAIRSVLQSISNDCDNPNPPCVNNIVIFTDALSAIKTIARMHHHKPLIITDIIIINNIRQATLPEWRTNVHPLDSWTLWYSGTKCNSRQTSETIKEPLRHNTMSMSRTPTLHPSRSYKRSLGRFAMIVGLVATLVALTTSTNKL